MIYILNRNLKVKRLCYEEIMTLLFIWDLASGPMPEQTFFLNST
jgi:hypothetical protein